MSRTGINQDGHVPAFLHVRVAGIAGFEIYAEGRAYRLPQQHPDCFAKFGKRLMGITARIEELRGRPITPDDIDRAEAFLAAEREEKAEALCIVRERAGAPRA